jgi:hypothetical protein
MEDHIDLAIEQALAGKPRASEIADMVGALERRREALVRDRSAAGDDAARREWDRKIREVDRQIATLREEKAITEFVEASVRATALRSRPETDAADGDVDDYEEPM